MLALILKEFRWWAETPAEEPPLLGGRAIGRTNMTGRGNVTTTAVARIHMSVQFRQGRMAGLRVKRLRLQSRIKGVTIHSCVALLA